MDKYNHLKIEKKWQTKWAKDKIYQTKETKGKPKAYVLDMFPYPSGEGLHVGHPKGYIATDIYSRFKRMNGFNVLHPMGWDAFGLPAENYAIKNKINPEISVKKNIKIFKSQLEKIGFDYDWSREINTTDPKYYQWTQWAFLQMFKKGLAYESWEPINWCPSCQTGLANEDLEDGKCERCGSEVIKKPMRQWILKITSYADRLLKDLDGLNWPESIKESQRNWIGRSEGTELSFPIKTKAKYVILHGWKSSSKRCWIPWLKRELEAKGHEVITLDLPHTFIPDVIEQAEYVLSKVKFDANTIIVGHSLGSVVSYRILERLKTPIKKLVLVGGLIEPKFRDKTRIAAKYLMSWKFDLEKIKKNAGQIIILEDDNDSIIPDGESNVIQTALGGKPYRLKAEQPHFCGTVEPLVLEHCLDQIKVFTTRADTLFGATYLVVAPEHKLISDLAKEITNFKEVKRYIALASKRSEIERVAEGKEKTGVELKGIKAINPANGQEIPIFAADYVLPDYGTGAIMAVPAHDNRDYQFAKKFKLPIRQVIMPSLIDASNPPQKGKEDTFRKLILAIVYDPQTKKYLTLRWKKQPWVSFVTGGIEEGEDAIKAAKREILEETGFKNIRLIRSLGYTEAFFFAAHKDVNRKTHAKHFLFELLNYRS
ncbi:MAG: alpha/beta fold hydrolase, partial [Candidatus Paceibacterota bacterium]